MVYVRTLMVIAALAVITAGCGADDAPAAGDLEPLAPTLGAGLEPSGPNGPDVWTEVAWIDRYERFDQMVADADILVRGTITGIEAGRFPSTGTARAFRVEIVEQFAGEPRTEILFEDGSADLPTGISTGVEGSPWLARGDEVFLFLAANDAISDGASRAYEVRHAYSVVRVADDGSLENAPRVDDRVVADRRDDLGRAIADALAVIASPGYVRLPGRDALAAVQETRTSSPVPIGATTAPWGEEAELFVAGTEGGFCWAVVSAGTEPLDAEWSCPTFDVVTALAASGPYILSSGLDSPWLVGVGPISGTEPAPAGLLTKPIDPDSFGFEVPADAADLQVYFGVDPEAEGPLGSQN